jgi:type II secretory pathway component PulF
MNQYTYTAYDVAGAKHQGEISAVDLRSAQFKIKEMGLIPVKLDVLSALQKSVSSRFQILARIKPGLSDVEFFSSQMAMLLKNGIRIDKALGTTVKTIRNVQFKRAAVQIHNEIRSGIALSRSLEKFPDIFDPMYISIASIGEATGKLAGAFEQIAANLSFRKNVRSKTRQALIYPSVIFMVCVLSIVFIFNFVVPKFEVLFSGMKTLPIYTELLLTISRFFTEYQWWLLGVAIAVPIWVKQMNKIQTVKSLMDMLLINIPVVRYLSYSLENLRFVSSMAILLKSGILLVDALGYAIRSIGNVRVQKQLISARGEVKQGRKLSEALTRTGFLPEIYIGVIEVGEQTGNLTEIFSDMEARFKDDYENRLAAMITLLEPIMILVMGLIVGSVVVIMLLSIVSVNDLNF